MASTPFLIVNGVSWPCPHHGFTYVWATAVNSGRNANNAVIGQVVGRQVIKFDAMEWIGLYANDWHKILQSLEPFYVNVEYYDVRLNKRRTVQMYPGNRSATPLFLDENGDPYQYENCKVNLIDCGL